MGEGLTLGRERRQENRAVGVEARPRALVGMPRPRSQRPRDLLTDCFLFFVIVHKPEKVSWTEAAGTVRDGVRAYTALHYLSQLSPGKWVLIMDGASVGANSLLRNRPKRSNVGTGPPFASITLCQ